MKGKLSMLMVVEKEATGEEWLDIQQALAYLRKRAQRPIPLDTFYHWIARGRVQHERVSGVRLQQHRAEAGGVPPVEVSLTAWGRLEPGIELGEPHAVSSVDAFRLLRVT